MKIIGIGYKAGSGKDTVARLIQYYTNPYLVKYFTPEQYIDLIESGKTVKLNNNKFRIKRFSKPLKTIFKILKNIDLSNRYLRNTYRQELQLLGDKLKEWSPNCLIQSLFSKLKKENFYIIPDVRTIEECNNIKQKNGILINVQKSIENEHDNHYTENSLDSYEEWDFIIDNNKSVKHLTVQVKNICKQLNLI